MARDYPPIDYASPPPLRFVPPGVCDHCCKACCTLDQARIRCYHCAKGTFVHRGELTFVWCPCRKADPWCKMCQGKGVIATPRA